MIADLVGIGVIGLICAAWIGLSQQFKERDDTRVRRMRCTPVNAAAEGALVCVDGHVTASATLHAPMSGRPCIYYRLEIFPLSGREVSERRPAEFFLRDETGCARVPLNAFRLLSDGVVGHLPHAETQLGVRGAPGSVAAVEYTIGGRVRVVGVARFEPDPGSLSYRESERRLVIEAPPNAPLLILPLEPDPDRGV